MFKICYGLNDQNDSGEKAENGNSCAENPVFKKYLLFSKIRMIYKRRLYQTFKKERQQVLVFRKQKYRTPNVSKAEYYNIRAVLGKV